MSCHKRRFRQLWHLPRAVCHERPAQHFVHRPAHSLRQPVSKVKGGSQHFSLWRLRWSGDYQAKTTHYTIMGHHGASQQGEGTGRHLSLCPSFRRLRSGFADLMQPFLQDHWTGWQKGRSRSARRRYHRRHSDWNERRLHQAWNTLRHRHDRGLWRCGRTFHLWRLGTVARYVCGG